MNITTPYTRDVVFLDIDSGCITDSKINYDPYDLFVLRSRLLPFIHEYLGKSYDLYFTRVEELKKEKIIIKPILGETIIPLSDMMKKTFQDKVDEELKLNVDHALIFNTNHNVTEYNSHIIPGSWLKQIIRFIDVVPSEYQPVIHNNNLYADLKNEIEYSRIYEELSEKIYLQIIGFYEKGFMVDAENIEGDWMLERVHNQVLEGKYSLPKLFKPKWENKKFAPFVVDFLLERIAGKNHMTLEINSNNVTRHYISVYLMLNKIFHYYQDRFIFIKVNNYNEATRWTNFCFDSAAMSSGKVLTLVADRFSWIKIYVHLFKSTFPENEDYIVYFKKDILPEIVFSGSVALHTDLKLIVEQFMLRARRLLLFLRDNHKTDDIHGMIEKSSYIFPKEFSNLVELKNQN